MESCCNRRSFFRRSGAILTVPFLSDVAAENGQSDIIRTLSVSGMEPIVVAVTELGNWDFIRLRTKNGITGIGEASHSGSSREKVQAFRDLFPLLEGANPFEIELFRKRFLEKGPHSDGPLTTAYCGMEQALWDICGKALEMPVFRLLGGAVHGKLRTYANINRATRGINRTPEGFARNAENALKNGYDAVKAAPFDYMPRPEPGRPLGEWKRIAEEGTNCIRAMRRAIGRENDLLIDVHSKFDREFAIEMADELSAYNLFWYEEPVNPVNAEDLAAIRRASPVPVAGGEHVWGHEGFFPLFAGKAVDIAMPDVKHCGGILEMKKISATAEAAGILTSPHNPSGPVATAASLQVCATLPNFQILEYAWGEVPWSRELVDPPEEFHEGRLTVPDRPGLGIEFNEKVLKRYRVS